MERQGPGHEGYAEHAGQAGPFGLAPGSGQAGDGQQEWSQPAGQWAAQQQGPQQQWGQPGPHWGPDQQWSQPYPQGQQWQGQPFGRPQWGPPPKRSAAPLGDHTSTPPTPEAMAAMGSLLGWLASRYAVDLAPGRRVTFVSRGSNRWPRGRRVSTDPIAGHRDMSLTQCPGDALYPLVRSRLWPQARAVTGSTAVARQGGSTSTGPARPTPKPTQTPTTPASSPPTTSAATPLTPAQPPPSSAVATPLAASASVDEGLSARDALPVVGVLGVGGGAAIAAHLARRPRR